MTAFMRWHDFGVPKDEIDRGPNEIVLRMAPVEGKRPDDYLYLGIDTTVPGRNSFVRFGAGAPWQADRLNVPGGRGEYMVRLYLLSQPRTVEARWLPADDRREDARQMICYAGSHGPTTRVEWNPRRVDRLEPRAGASGDRRRPAVLVSPGWMKPARPWSSRRGPGAGGRGDASAAAGVPAQRRRVAQEPGSAFASRCPLRPDYHPLPRPIDIAPAMQPPAGRAADRTAVLPHRGGPHPAGQPQPALRVRAAGRPAPARVAVQRIHGQRDGPPAGGRGACGWSRSDGNRYAGSRDFACREIAALDGGRAFERRASVATAEHRPAWKRSGRRRSATPCGWA